MNQLENALRSGDVETANAALKRGERLSWRGYWGAMIEAQNQNFVHVARWFRDRTQTHQYQDLLYPSSVSFSGLSWVGLNARLYQHNDAYTQTADLLIEMAEQGDLLNAPMAKADHAAKYFERAAPEGWRLLHSAAEAKNLALIQALLQRGAHPDGFDPVVLSHNEKKGRYKDWAWTPIFRSPPACPPALLCADSAECLRALEAAGANLSARGKTNGAAAPSSIFELSLPFIRSHWRSGRRHDAFELARFWLDRAKPSELARLALDPELSPAEGMLRLKGLSAAASAVFPPGEGGALDRLRFDLSAFERQRGRKCLNALRSRDFPALAAELRAAASAKTPFDEWTIGGRHILMLGLSFSAALPERQTQETLHGAGFDRDQRAAAFIELAAELAGPRAVFAPFPGEPGSLAHYCALGFGPAANQACVAAAAAPLGPRLRLAENPLNWALWSENQAALDAWSRAGPQAAALTALYPSSRHPIEMALERGALPLCKALAEAHCPLDAPSSLPGQTLRQLILSRLEAAEAAQQSHLAHGLRDLLCAAERSELDRSTPEPGPLARPRSI